jgi:hypothetical protein
MIKQKLDGLFLFGRKIWFATGTISFFIWALGDFAAGKLFLLSFGAIFSVKLITDGFVYLLFQNMNTKSYLFFQNLGLSRLQLWLFTFIVDFVAFLLIVFLFSQIK